MKVLMGKSSINGPSIPWFHPFMFIKITIFVTPLGWFSTKGLPHLKLETDGQTPRQRDKENALLPSASSAVTSE
jgi:hypothetical protein